MRPALLLAIGALVCAAFMPVFQASFVNWDDDHNLLENYAYRGLTWSHLGWMATTHHMGLYQPLFWLSLGLDHALWGMDARGYHCTNVLLHVLAAVAFYSLARELLRVSLRGPRAAPTALDLDLAAFVAALLFALHPLRCESVAWVSERRDVLSGWLLLTTVLAYLRFVRTGGAARKRWYGLALALFFLSLSAKATGVVLPAVLLVLDRWPLERDRRETARTLWLEKAPFALLALLFVAGALWAARSEGALKTLAQHDLVQRLVQAGYALSFYVQKTIWPTDLIPIYAVPREFDPLELRYVGWAVAAIACTALLFLFRQRLRPAWSAWSCFVILLLPVSGLVQVGPQFVADRYSYLSCTPFALLAAGGWLVWRIRRPSERAVANQVAGALILLLAIATWRQARIWHDSDSLWSHTLSVDPDNTDACQNLGVVRMRRGTEARDPRSQALLWSQALALFEHGYAVSPNAESLVNQGLIYMLLSGIDPAHARELLAKARALVERGLEQLMREPGGVQPSYKLQYGIVLLELQDYGAADLQLEDYVHLRPDDPDGLRAWSDALTNLGRPQEALTHLRRALELEPGDPTLWIRLGRTSKQLGQLGEARAHFERAIELRKQELGAAARGDPVLAEAENELEHLTVAR